LTHQNVDSAMYFAVNVIFVVFSWRKIKKKWKKEKKRDNAASIGPVTSLDEMQSGLLDWQKKPDWDVSNQSTVRKSDQSEITISGRLANQITGKRTNQKPGYKKKQPIDSIDTKSSFYKKKQRRESRDTHFLRHVT
jgi:hypothetical protein